MLEIKEEFRRENKQKKHEIGFICPVCKITIIRTFVTHININKKDLEFFINGEKQYMYDTHVLNCN